MVYQTSTINVIDIISAKDKWNFIALYQKTDPICSEPVYILAVPNDDQFCH
jgi:hypothetical protein